MIPLDAWRRANGFRKLAVARAIRALGVLPVTDLNARGYPEMLVSQEDLERIAAHIQDRTKGERAPLWTPEEDAILAEKWLRATNAEVQELFPGRSLAAVRIRYSALAKKGLVVAERKAKSGSWTAQEDAILAEKWANSSIPELLQSLQGKTALSIAKRAKKLGLIEV